MQNTGKTFEKTIEEVFNFMYKNYQGATIRHDVQLDGPDGNRQFDVVITVKVPDDEIITVIEGKDYKNKISIQKVDEFHSKMRDVNANKGILISKMGFSTKAISKAKRFGILLYSLNDHTEFKEFDLKIPFLIEEVSPKNMNIFYRLSREQIGQHSNIYFDKKGLLINETSVNDIINQSWKDGSLKFDLIEGKQEVDIPNIYPPYYLNFFTHQTLNIAEKMEITHLKLQLTIQHKYYLCDIRDIMYDKILKNITKEKLTLFIDANSLPEILKNLVPVSPSYAQEFTGIQHVIKIKNNADVEFTSMSLAYSP